MTFLWYSSNKKLKNKKGVSEYIDLELLIQEKTTILEYFIEKEFKIKKNVFIRFSNLQLGYKLVAIIHCYIYLEITFLFEVLYLKRTISRFEKYLNLSFFYSS